VIASVSLVHRPRVQQVRLTDWQTVSSCRREKERICPKSTGHVSRNFSVDWEVANLWRTCCRLVSDTVSCLDMSRCRQQVRNKLATWNRIWETTQQTKRTFARANLLRTCYGFATGKRRNGFWPIQNAVIGFLPTFRLLCSVQ